MGELGKGIDVACSVQKCAFLALASMSMSCHSCPCWPTCAAAMLNKTMLASSGRHGGENVHAAAIPVGLKVHRDEAAAVARCIFCAFADVDPTNSNWPFSLPARHQHSSTSTTSKTPDSHRNRGTEVPRLGASSLQRDRGPVSRHHSMPHRRSPK
jgi:hypothetical protein